jgi:hypothetical protein
MSQESDKRVALDREMKKLKTEEARFRYLATGNKTSPEYRKEALAKLEDVRRRIYQLSGEIAAAGSSEARPL